MGMMPGWGDALGGRGVEDMLAYLYSLQGRSLAAGDRNAGQQKFGELCAACHGADGRGKQEMGTPNLTDGVWLHGGALTTVRDTITHGRTGNMPAHLDRLGETRVKLLAAYVLSLSQADARPVAQADVTAH
jgi:cytochrome c oxidase cbb3-type subunit 3